MPAEQHSELRHIHATLEWQGAFASLQHVRGHAFTVDEPAKLGGKDAGPTPLEYVLGSYNACLQIVIVMIARELQLHVQSVELESVATVDRRGLFGTAPVSPHYQRIECTIRLGVDDADGVAIERLKELHRARCPMYNLVKDAGIEQELTWLVSLSGKHADAAVRGA
ncbi:OsmC family peroxiredoxin [bacterium]|nr:MAG: OsmC family peroxiredoxin [bacterium]